MRKDPSMEFSNLSNLNWQYFCPVEGVAGIGGGWRVRVEHGDDGYTKP